MKRLFLFRPDPGARHSADRARGLGLEVTTIPLFEIESVEWAAPDAAGFDALLLTSANAVRFGGDQLDRLRNLPVHAVGEATAHAAEAAGFGIAGIGEGGVDALLSAIGAGTRLLHLCGEDRRMPDHPPHAIACVCVYRARPLARPAGLEELAGHVAAVHSPRAARRLAELVAEPERPGVCIAAISAAAAQAAGSGWCRIEAAAAPTDAALLALAARLCES